MSKKGLVSKLGKKYCILWTFFCINLLFFFTALLYSATNFFLKIHECMCLLCIGVKSAFIEIQEVVVLFFFFLQAV